MKWIISASRRTDLPAYYSLWTYKRFKEGYVLVKNPFNPSQVQRISLTPENVLGVAFWTRYFKPMEEYLNFFMDNYDFYILYTLNHYPKKLEPYNPPFDKVVENIKALSKKIGKERIIWRYDPIFLTQAININWHKENFHHLYEKIGSYVSEIYTSILVPYKKTVKNFNKIGEKLLLPTLEEIDSLVDFLKKLVRIPIYSCCTPQLIKAGIEAGACVSAEKFQKITSDSWRKQELKKIKKNPTRPGCNCSASKDIGAYGTCPAGCTYCYATANRERAATYLRNHDPDREMM